MTPEERIAQLERDLADERAERKRLASIVERMVLAQIDREQAEQTTKAMRRARNTRHRSGDASEAVSCASPETSQPFPPPLKGSPPPSVPSSPSPISSPPSLFPPSAVASKAPRRKGGVFAPDPRHAPLVKDLTDAGYPFHGGKDAKAVSTLLALADQREASRGEAAGVEVLRRARIAWAWVGFPACKSLTELASHWGHYEHEQARGAGPPRATDGLMPAPASECAGCGAEGETASVGEPSVLLGYWCGCMAEWARAGLHFTKAREWADRRKHGG